MAFSFDVAPNRQSFWGPGLVGSTIRGYGQANAGRYRTVVVLDPFDLSVTPWVEVTAFEHALNTPLAQEFLNGKFFREWLSVLGQDHLEFDSCAGVNVPGFYGGARELGDLSHDSNEVYLSFVQQLWEQRLANGTGAAATHRVVQEEL